MRLGRRHRRRGFTLLEALIALNILAVAGAVTVRLVHESARQVVAAQHRDDEFARASAFMNAVSLWSAGDLDRHLGTRVQGDWRMYVERASGEPTYRIVLFDSTRRQVLLETRFHRHGHP